MSGKRVFKGLDASFDDHVRRRPGNTVCEEAARRRPTSIASRATPIRASEAGSGTVDSVKLPFSRKGVGGWLGSPDSTTVDVPVPPIPANTPPEVETV